MDKQFVVLKRESSYYKPIYCFYSIKSKEANKVELKKSFYKKLPYTISYELSQDERIFEDFTDKNNFIIINLFNPTSIMYDLQEQYSFNKFFDVNITNYKFNINGEWVCPKYKANEFVNDYAELKYKNDMFKYQHERRFIIHNIDLKENNLILYYDKILNFDIKFLNKGPDKLKIDVPLLQNDEQSVLELTKLLNKDK